MSSHEGRPDFKSPQLGCDTHFHVFGPAGRYPYNQADLRYAPPVAPVEEFLALAGKLGIGRFVFVQPSAYGRDNRCMLDAMRKIGAAKCRGIVDIDENAPDAELERLDALGVRGVRINVSPVKPFEAGVAAKVGSIELWNLLGKWAPEETLRRRILVDNPQRLFKFW